MRVLLLSDMAVPHGGGEVMVFTIRDELRRRGHDARIFASSARPVQAPSEADYECFGTTGRARGLVQSANPWAASALRRVMREFRPDMVHVTMFMTQLSPLILPVIRGVPALFHAVWYRYVCPTGTKMLPTRVQCRDHAGMACLRGGCLPFHDWVPLMAQHAMVRRWGNVFGAIMAVSDVVRDRLVENGVAVDDIIPAPVPVREPRPPLPDLPTVLFAGRLVPDKGPDVLMRAFARVQRELPAARLTIIGDGPERAHLETLRRQLALTDTVEMRPRVPNEELQRTGETAWVQAIPSVWDEPFGLAVAEAMMRGTAVVASRSGGLPSVVGDLDPYSLVTPDDEDALAASLLAFLTDRARCERAGEAGRRSALQRFAADRVVDRFIEHYARLGAVERAALS